MNRRYSQHGIEVISRLTTVVIYMVRSSDLMREIIDAAKDAGVSAIIAADISRWKCIVVSSGALIHTSSALERGGGEVYPLRRCGRIISMSELKTSA